MLSGWGFAGTLWAAWGFAGTFCGEGKRGKNSPRRHGDRFRKGGGERPICFCLRVVVESLLGSSDSAGVSASASSESLLGEGLVLSAPKKNKKLF